MDRLFVVTSSCMASIKIKIPQKGFGDWLNSSNHKRFSHQRFLLYKFFRVEILLFRLCYNLVAHAGFYESLVLHVHFAFTVTETT